MNKYTRNLAHGAIIAALYAVLCYFQNAIFPDSATWAVQLRLAEALTILAFFTPAAVPGLTLGCLLFNLSFSGALPLDFLVGTLATFLAAQGMYMMRKRPVCGLFLPTISNGLLVGWELTVYVGGGFWINGACVALGEVIVMLTFGAALYSAMKKRKLDVRLFG